MRVQIPAYHDMWMKGDRWGDVLKTVTAARSYAGARAALLTNARGRVEIAFVKLDKSGKTVKVILDDCTVVDTFQWKASARDQDSIEEGSD